MSSFSLRHRLHLLFVLQYGWACAMMHHDSECLMSLSRKFQMCLPNFIDFLRCGCLNDAVSFLYLVLKSLSVSPM